MLVRRRIFVSYHHAGDQAYYDVFHGLFDATFGVICDRSVDRVFDTDSAEYVMRRIRESYIRGTSCTVVLCGANSWQRKYIDWEIRATLNQEGALIGINLPTNPLTPQGSYTVPARLHDNIQSGYAAFYPWSSLEDSRVPVMLNVWVEQALSRSKRLIANSRPTMRRNL
jgi:hypothetical protein